MKIVLFSFYNQITSVILNSYNHGHATKKLKLTPNIEVFLSVDFWILTEDFFII